MSLARTDGQRSDALAALQPLQRDDFLGPVPGDDYVSCSPFRVPVAPLEAARAVLLGGAG